MTTTEVSTDYGYYVIKQGKKLIMVSNIDFDPKRRYAVSKQTVKDILNSSVTSLDEHLLVILIASININRAIHDPKEQEKYRKLTEKTIANGLTKIFQTSCEYSEESLLSIFSECKPEEVEEILTTPYPVNKLKNL